MKFGISYPDAEIGTDRIVIRDFAQAVEELGYSHISVHDHVIQSATPRESVDMAKYYTRDFPHHEPMIVMAFLAGVTETIGINPAIVILPQRQTVLVAKQAAQIDVLCGGRLRFGVGIGWNGLEFEALGMDFKNRGKRLEEQIEVLRLLWTQEIVTFHGKWHTINEAGLAPMPIQRPPEIWFGAVSDVAVRRAARIGDGWFMISRLAPDDESRRVAEVFREAVQEGAGICPRLVSNRWFIPSSVGRMNGSRTPVRGSISGQPSSSSEPLRAGTRLLMNTWMQCGSLRKP